MNVSLVYSAMVEVGFGLIARGIISCFRIINRGGKWLNWKERRRSVDDFDEIASRRCMYTPAMNRISYP